MEVSNKKTNSTNEKIISDTVDHNSGGDVAHNENPPTPIALLKRRNRLKRMEEASSTSMATPRTIATAATQRSAANTTGGALPTARSTATQAHRKASGKARKPPPINVSYQDTKDTIQLLKSKNIKSDFHIKKINNYKHAIQLTSHADFDTVKEALTSIEASFYSFTPKHKRNHDFLFKGLPSSFSEQEVGEDLQQNTGKELTIVKDKGKRTIGTQTPNEWMVGQGGSWVDKVGSRVGNARGYRKNEGLEGGGRGKETRIEKGTAILINTGKSYKKALEGIKKRIGSPKGIGIRRIRETRTGGVLFEMETKESGKEWRDTVKERMGSETDVRILENREGIKIRGIDSTISREEVIKRIVEEEGLGKDEEEQIEVVRLITEPWQEKTALIKISKEVADRMIKKERIRIGWTNCRISGMPGLMIRCWKCGRFGHNSMGCKGKGNGTTMEEAFKQAEEIVRGMPEVKEVEGKKKGST
ncbi:hypothetical protein ANTPLA_LOCUS2888 [Anthophora plagiata]